ncbi:DUF6452 family protein [Psychroflexus planctonicus]|uniref:DUF4249 family protein n=1 Tax=Psychroflexus planctonicus TaxID=1526575 RepID=A0ABQ1SGN1_9FLAO|nr:DUF6452 family protein [Psychroflexus planctonicus]GGE29898.1 hypothetical protein GCM10010832_08030 [Psychroflexus planctonicus]
MKSKLFYTLLIVSFLFLGCERDDICSEAFQVTPKLIIEFYDINDQEDPKNVADLSIFAIGSEDTISFGNTNRIEIPLQTNQESTRYAFVRQATSEDFINLDEINFTYVTQDIYVNRACGYKTEFLDFQAVRIIEDNPENNWMRSLNVQQTFINEDQDEPHLFIFH